MSQTTLRPAVGGGSFVGKASARISVRDYGATGDGTTNDTAAVLAAVAAAKTLTAAFGSAVAVHVPAGTFMVAGIVLDYDKAYLTGDGPASILKMRSGQGTTTDIVTVKKAASAQIADVTITHLAFDGNKAAYPDGDVENELVNGSNTKNFTVAHCTFKDAASDGLDLDSANTGVRVLHSNFVGCQRTGVHLYGPYNGLVLGNTFDDCGMEYPTSVGGVSAQAPGAIDIVNDPAPSGNGTPATGLRIIGNTVTNSLQGIKCSADRPYIAGNYLKNIIGWAGEGNLGHAIYVVSLGIEPLIEGNVIDGCLLDGIYTPGGTVIGNDVRNTTRYGITVYVGGTPRDGLVIGNRVRSAGVDGITCSQRSTVRGNHVVTPVGDGISVSAAGCIIDGNFVDTPTVRGIYSPVADTAVTNNRVKGGTIGVYILSASATDNLVDGNYVTGTSDHGINLSFAVRTSVRNNRVIGVTTTNKAGIAFTSANGPVVRGNYCSGNYWGILVGASSTNHDVQNNTFLGNTNADLTISGSVGAGGVVARNRTSTGSKTENAGTATVTAAATTVVVNHGLYAAPPAELIQAQPTNSMGTATKFWVSTITATQFTINVDLVPGATTATFAWSARSAA